MLYNPPSEVYSCACNHIWRELHDASTSIAIVDVIPCLLSQLLGALKHLLEVKVHILVDITSRERLSREAELLQNVALCIKDFLPRVSEVERVDIEDHHRFLAPLLLELVHIVNNCHDIFDLPRGLLYFCCNK